MCKSVQKLCGREKSNAIEKSVKNKSTKIKVNTANTVNETEKRVRKTMG